jgi:hypothetical protein
MRNGTVTLLIVLAAAAAFPTVARGQDITGRVVDHDRQPVAYARITLVGAEDRALLVVDGDSSGRFTMRLPAPGSYHLRIERLGYEPRLAGPVTFAGRETIEVQIDYEAIELAPIVAHVQRGPATAAQPEVARRMARGRQTGEGRFLMRDELEYHAHRQVSNLVLSTAYVPHSYDRRGNFHIGDRVCAGGVFLNGVRIRTDLVPLDELFAPDQLEAVEIYRRGEVPIEYADGRLCTALVLWTRVGGQTDREFNWRRMVLGALGIGAILAAIVTN